MTTRLAIGSAFLGLLAATAPASGQGAAKAWDQEAMVGLTKRFLEQTKHIQEGVGRHVEEAAPDSPRRIVLDDVYAIHHRGVALATAVGAGQGRDLTEPIFRRLMSGVQNARQDAKRFPEIEAVRSYIDKANELLGEMAAYYGSG